LIFTWRGKRFHPQNVKEKGTPLKIAVDLALLLQHQRRLFVSKKAFKNSDEILQYCLFSSGTQIAIKVANSQVIINLNFTEKFAGEHN
jgi:hypothetical protein